MVGRSVGRSEGVVKRRVEHAELVSLSLLSVFLPTDQVIDVLGVDQMTQGWNPRGRDLHRGSIAQRRR